MTRIKVCGLTDASDAELAIELGAWALGVIFWRPSPRAATPAQAERIAAAARRRALLAGVFADATLDEIFRLHDRIGFDVIQLHGDEGTAYCAAVARRTGAKVCKAVRARTAGDVRALDAFRGADLHLIDAPWGTHDLDRTLLAARRSEIPLVLAGGLTAENVGVAIADAQPYAVDTASGTESEPGRKDPERLRAFFDAVAATEAAPEIEAEVSV